MVDFVFDIGRSQLVSMLCAHFEKNDVNFSTGRLSKIVFVQFDETKVEYVKMYMYVGTF